MALTSAFDQIEDALRNIGRGNGDILDVACLSTFAMRWLIPRLHEFTTIHPRFDLRLATDNRHQQVSVDVRILVVPPHAELPKSCVPLFNEKLALVVAPALVPDRVEDMLTLPRLETRTRPQVWQEWIDSTGEGDAFEPATTRIFDHYHMTIESALNSLGMAIAPWHLVAADIGSSRLAAPFGEVDSKYVYAVDAPRPNKAKTRDFVNWRKEATQEFRD